jgi:phosphatidylserine decarboxylase
VIEEHVPLYLRACYQIMYQNPVGRRVIKFGFLKNLLKRSTARHGLNMDSPTSVAHLKEFILIYKVNVAEAERPLEEYRTFNEFFSRKLKSDARPIASPTDDRVLVSAADCRMVCYQSVASAERIWLKGTPIDLPELVGHDFRYLLSSELQNPAIAIARLAPNDYHRWHMPARAQLVKRTLLDGTYYSVSPRAVRACNVLTTNKRVVCLMDSSAIGLGHWLLIAVGAAMVASIKIRDDLREGESTLNKGEEHGYFQFGGSTLVLLFDSRRMRFDDDLIRSSSEAMEVYLKMGEQLGRVASAAADASSAAEATVAVSLSVGSSPSPAPELSLPSKSTPPAP